MTGAERQAKYRASGKHYAAVKRYRQTAKGRAETARNNAKQIRIGDHYVGYCADATTAAAIRTHIRERLRAFQRLQSRTETQGGSTGTVPTETGA